jgi:hypothetical protein
MPLRCPRAFEADSLGQEIRQLDFGLGKHPTHRIVSTVADDVVTILRVRHVAQDALSERDLG